MPVSEAHRMLLTHAPTVRRYITSRIPRALRRDVDTDDVLHDVWTRVLRAHTRMSMTEIADLERYLKCVASSVLVDKLRAQQAVKRGGGVDGARLLHPNDLRTSYANLFERVAGPRRTPSSEIAIREAVVAVRSALARIPDTQREAVRLHHLVGLSYEEVGHQMNRSPAAVHGLLTRGMSSLKTELKSATRFLSDAASDAD